MDPFQIKLRDWRLCFLAGSTQLQNLVESGFFETQTNFASGPRSRTNLTGLDLAFPYARNGHQDDAEMRTSVSPDISTLCRTCASFEDWLGMRTRTSRRIPPSFYLGLWRQVRRRITCRVCRLVCEITLLNIGTHDDCYVAGAMVQLVLRGDKAQPIVEEGFSRGPIADVNILLSHQNMDNGETALGSRINHGLQFLSAGQDQDGLPSWADPQACRVPRRVDILRLRSWMDTCRLTHGEHCSRNVIPNLNLPPTNFEVLDVKNLNIISAPVPCSYAALSYVWGSIKPPKPDIFIANGRQVRTYSLVRPNLPRTIQDAIKLTGQLQFKYLWVDALCINQDDTANKMTQIMQMDKIYNSADLTIVAADGRDSDAGLPGTEATGRLSTQLEARLQSVTLITTLPNRRSPAVDTSIIEGSWWNKRAWTYQEKIMSKRCVFFTGYQTYFVCRQHICREDLSTSTEHLAGDALNTIERYAKYQKSYIEKGIFSLEPFAGFVNEYSRRRLSKQTDCLLACFSALDQISAMYGSPTFWGLTEALFDLALRWELETAPRDNASHQCPKARPSFPSWSWASTTGAVMFASHWPAYMRCCRWYKEKRDGSLVPIASTFRNSQKEYNQPRGSNRQEMEEWQPQMHRSRRDPATQYWNGSEADLEYSGLIVFWTTITKLKLQLCEVSKQPSVAGLVTYNVVGGDGSAINSTALAMPGKFKSARNDDEGEFALIGRIADEVGVLLLGTMNNVRYRVGFCRIWLNDWEKADRQWTLLHLG